MAEPRDRDGSPRIVLKHTFADELSFNQAKSIRRQVFIVEQEIPEAEEWDAEDETATHVIAYVGNTPAGTARFYPDDGWLRIGRVAVLPPFRGHGLGHALLRHCLEQGTALGYGRSFLNAQADKQAFYQAHGFHPVGDVFDEAGIPHIRMELKL